MTRRADRALIVGASVLALAAAAAWGLSRFTPEPAPPRWLDFTPTAAQAQKMQDLRAKLRPGEARFPREDQRVRENAQLFTYMAGTSEDELVVMASLDAMRTAYGARNARKASPDRDVERVLRKHLESGNPVRMAAAFEAASIPLMSEQAGDELLGEVVHLAREGQTPAVRLAALEALCNVPPNRRTPAVLQAFLDQATGEPALAVTALVGLKSSGAALNEHPELRELARRTVETLTKSGEPGVRGTALEVLVGLVDPTGFDQVAELSRKLVADPNPYVRGMAARTLGSVGTPADLHVVLDLTSDEAEARTVVRGLRRLDGSEAEIPRKVGGMRTVADCARRSEQALSERAPSEQAPSVQAPSEQAPSEQAPPERSK